MGSIKEFEDLIAWQKARELTKAIYQVTENGRFARDFGLRDQIRRAAVSIMSNIAEGFEHGSNAEFYRFLAMARASCAEVRSQLYIACDIGYIDQPTFDELMALASQTARIIGGLRSSVAKKLDR